MAWRFVQQPNGRLARFSEVVDDFTHMGLTKEQAIEVCQREYNMDYAAASAKVQRGIDAGAQRWEESLRIIANVHGEDAATHLIGAAND